MNKHVILTDNNLNGELKKQVSTLRGGIVEQANKQDLPSRFQVEAHKDLPKMIVTDKETDRCVEVPLFSYGEVRRVLNSLFKD